MAFRSTYERHKALKRQKSNTEVAAKVKAGTASAGEKTYHKAVEKEREAYHARQKKHMEEGTKIMSFKEFVTETK